MIIHHMIILLLCWRWAIVIGKEDQSDDVNDDQIAMASMEMSLGTTNRPTTVRTTMGSTTLLYENSNGFVPITTINGITEPRTSPIAIFNDEDDETIDLPITGESGLENDPAYSTEARMFLNLAGPSADRRSFDSQDGQSEFEILKVNNETPAIANYQDFYENVRNNLKRNRGQERQAEIESEIGRQIGSNKRTKERIKKIEKYLETFHDNRQQDNNDLYNRYYSGITNGGTSSQKDVFEPEKVSPTYHQPIYDVFNEGSSRPRSTLRSNHEESAMRQKPPSKNRHSKPVVVVEPIDYKQDMKYGLQRPTVESSSLDHQRSSKNRKDASAIELEDIYEEESRVNRKDRYRQSYGRNEEVSEYSEENDYAEVTERPKRIHKNRRRPYALETSRRLPKEHRGRQPDDQEIDDPEPKNNNNNEDTSTRTKLHRSKVKPSFWVEDDRGSLNEDTLDEHSNNGHVSTTKNDGNKSKDNSLNNGVPSWSQVAPNIEVSHSNGFEVDQLGKPKLLVPLNLNLVPLTNFDHSTALGNSQGFDFTNVPNFGTGSSITGNSASLLTNPQQMVPNSGNSSPTSKNNGNPTNNNYGSPTTSPEIIVGQNTFNNPVHTLIVPQMSVNGKFASNLRSHYAQSTMAPMFTVTQSLPPNVHNIAPTISNVPNFSTTPSPRIGNAINQNFHHMTLNPIPPGVNQFLLPQPTLQTFPLIHAPYNPNGNYNILVNPNGLHGQNIIQQGQANQASGHQYSSTTTPQPNLITNNNFHEAQFKKNVAPNSNGQFVASASFAVGNDGHHQAHQQQQQQQREQLNIPNDNRHLLTPNNQNVLGGNDPNHYNGGSLINQNILTNPNNYNFNQNSQVPRAQQTENIYQFYGLNQNNNGKTYSNHVVPTIIHPGQSIPVNFNNQQFTNVGGNLHEQQSVLSPSVLPNRSNDQNQQILKAANDIFENTWKQLRQLQNNDDESRRYQHVYRINDNVGATSNTNANTINNLPINSAKAHLPILSAQNVEIINPNIKPSPIDVSLMNPYNNLNHYQAAVLTTPIPILSTTANYLAQRPIVVATTASAMNLQNYVDSLTQYGIQNSNQGTKNDETRTGNVKGTDGQRQLYNPINFVPNIDLMRSQSTLNSKSVEPLPDQLNLVPVIPGGNFFKNSQGAHTELIKKPRLSSDLERYADEMLRESLRTIYNTHAWNNDRRLRGNYSVAELSELAKLKSDLQRFKTSFSDGKYNGKDLLEAHHSETKVRTAEPSNNRPSKKPDLTIAEIEQLFKSDPKLNFQTESHQKSRPNSGSNGSSRPSGSSLDHSKDFRNIKQLTDYLTPPKVNSFISKSPFIDSPKTSKKRPPSSQQRYNSASGGSSRNLPRPSSLISRPTSGNLDTSASNKLESGVRSHRYEKQRQAQYSRDGNDNYDSSIYSGDSTDYRNYPTFTTTSSPDNDLFRSSSSGEQLFKTETYDINHPRMHNLLGLLMKNKQLPRGSSQSYFRSEEDLRQYFENEKRRIQTEFYDDKEVNMQKKSDLSLNMGPPALPKNSQIRYHPIRPKP